MGVDYCSAIKTFIRTSVYVRGLNKVNRTAVIEGAVNAGPRMKFGP